MLQINQLPYSINKTNPKQQPAFMGGDGNVSTVSTPQQTNIPSDKINMALRANALATSNTGFKDLGQVKLPYIENPAKLYQLDNGQKVVIVKKDGPTTIRTFVKVGSMNEPDKIRGMSHYIEHNLFNGSKDLAPGQYVDIINKRGGQYNASTGFATTDYYIESPLHEQKDLENFIKMQADAVKNPLFRQDMLDKEKGPVTSEIQMLRDDPGNHSVNLTLKNLFGIKTTSEDIIGGTVGNIDSITRQDVLNYYDKWYTPDNMTTIVVGDVNPDETIKLVNKYFNPKGEKTPTKSSNKYYEHLKATGKPVRVDLKKDNLEATSVTMAFAGPENDDLNGSVAALGMIIGLAGHGNSRLIAAMRDSNVYPSMAIETVGTRPDDQQAIMLSADFTPGTEEDGMKQMYGVLNEMAYKPLSDEELQIVKNKMKSGLKAVSESSMDISSLIGTSLLNRGSLDIYSKKLEAIDKLTATDIQNAAKQFLNLNAAAITVFHPTSQNMGESATSTQKSNIQDSTKISFSGAKNLSTGDVTEYNLSNNFRLALNDLPASPYGAANLDIKTDNLPPNFKPGIDVLLSTIMLYGTKQLSEDELNKFIDTNDIDLESAAYFDGISLGVSADKEKLPMALKLMEDSLLNPVFTQENLDRAKEEIKLSYMSQPKSPEDKVAEKIYGNHPYGVTPRIILENIDNITLADVINFHQYIMQNGRGCVTVSAPVSSDSALKTGIFNALQTGLPMVQPYVYTDTYQDVPIAKTSVIAEAERRDQAKIIQVFKFKDSGNIKDRVALRVLNEVLGGNSQSRLFMDLRENQKLAYSVNSSYDTDGKAGTLALQIMTTTENGAKGSQFENVPKSLDGFRKHVDNLIQQPISQAELEAAKLALKSQLMFDSESTIGKHILTGEGFSTPYGTEYIQDFFKEIDNITPQDIQNAARLYLDKPSVISILAGKDTINNNKTYLASLGELETYGV